MNQIPESVYLYRLIHIDNLEIYLKRQALHAPNYNPSDRLVYRTIHSVEIQDRRARYQLPCGPGGTLHDYVPFYFGYHSPMLFKLWKGTVNGYSEGQEPLIYLVSSIGQIVQAGCQWLFSDGQGNSCLTSWFDCLDDLISVDMNAVKIKQWKKLEDPDLTRRKQAEFLVYQSCPWDCIKWIFVYNSNTKSRVRQTLMQYPMLFEPIVKIWPKAYY